MRERELGEKRERTPFPLLPFPYFFQSFSVPYVRACACIIEVFRPYSGDISILSGKTIIGHVSVTDYYLWYPDILLTHCVKVTGSLRNDDGRRQRERHFKIQLPVFVTLSRLFQFV